MRVMVWCASCLSLIVMGGPTSGSPSGTAETDAVSFTVELAASSSFGRPASLQGVLVVDTYEARNGPPSRRVAVSVHIPGQVEIELPPRKTAWLRLSGDNFWAEPLPVLPTATGKKARITAIPSGKLTGRVTRQRPQHPTLGQLQPGIVEIQISLTSTSERGSPSPFKADIRCPISQDGAFECLAPAGTYDLRVSATGFAAAYLWEQTVPVNQMVDLGSLPLANGASLVGWLESPGAPLDPNLVYIALSRIDDGTPNPTTTPYKASLMHISSTRDAGFFQFKELSPGEYSLQAFAWPRISHSRKVLIVSDLEANLVDPLRLQRIASVILDVYPRTDPNGEPWQATLEALDSDAAFYGVVDFNGNWQQHFVPEGDYRLVIKTYRHDRWFQEEFRVLPDDPPRRIELDSIPILGKVTIGGSPTPATIRLGGSRFEANEDGRFEGHLPHEGTWKASVALPSQGSVLVDDVQVERPSPNAPAEIFIDLPNNEINGSVVDETGEPVSQARVQAILAGSESFSTTTRTDKEGNYVLRGLRNGDYMLSADAGRDIKSEVKVIELSDDGVLSDTVLVVKRQRELKCVVHSARGPIAMAKVYAIPAPENGRAAVLADSKQVTDAEGVAIFRIPPSLSAVNLVIVAPGFGSQLIWVPDPHVQQELTVFLEPIGGTISVTFPKTRSLDYYRLSEVDMAYQDGSRISLALLLKWLDGRIEPRQQKIILPMMQPGEYIACARTDGRARTKKPSQVAIGRQCDGGLLVPYGDLDLRIGSNE